MTDTNNEKDNNPQGKKRRQSSILDFIKKKPKLETNPDPNIAATPMNAQTPESTITDYLDVSVTKKLHEASLQTNSKDPAPANSKKSSGKEDAQEEKSLINSRPTPATSVVEVPKELQMWANTFGSGWAFTFF